MMKKILLGTLGVVALGAVAVGLVYIQEGGLGGRATGFIAGGPALNEGPYAEETGEQFGDFLLETCQGLVQSGVELNNCLDQLAQPLAEDELVDWLTRSPEPLCGGPCLLALSRPATSSVDQLAALLKVMAPMLLPLLAPITDLTTCIEQYGTLGMPAGLDPARCNDIDCGALEQQYRFARQEADRARHYLAEAQRRVDEAQNDLDLFKMQRDQKLAAAQSLMTELTALALSIMQAKKMTGCKLPFGPASYPGLTGPGINICPAVKSDPGFAKKLTELNSAYEDFQDALVGIAQTGQRLEEKRGEWQAALFDSVEKERTAQELAEVLTNCLKDRILRWLCRIRLQLLKKCQGTTGIAGKPGTSTAKLSDSPVVMKVGDSPAGGEGEKLCQVGATRIKQTGLVQELHRQTIHGAVRISFEGSEFSHYLNEQLTDQVLGIMSIPFGVYDALGDFGDLQGLVQPDASGLDYAVERLKDKAEDEAGAASSVADFVLSLKDIVDTHPIDSFMSFYSEAISGVTKGLHGLSSKLKSKELVTAAWFWVLGRWKGEAVTYLTYDIEEYCPNGNFWIERRINERRYTVTACEYLPYRDMKIRLTAGAAEMLNAARFIARAFKDLTSGGMRAPAGGCLLVDEHGNTRQQQPDAKGMPERVLWSNGDGKPLVLGRCDASLDVTPYTKGALPDYLDGL